MANVLVHFVIAFGSVLSVKTLQEKVLYQGLFVSALGLWHLLSELLVRVKNYSGVFYNLY